MSEGATEREVREPGAADASGTAPDVADGGSVARGVFLFSDIEDSTVLWEQYPEVMAEAVAAHDRIITEAVEAAGGEVVKRVGDAMDTTFDAVPDATAAAIAAQRELAERSWGELGALRVRMAIGAGPVTEREEGFFGPVLNQLGRILAAGHGGQVLLNEAAAEALDGAGGGAGDGDGVGVRSLGEFRFKGLTGAVEVLQLEAPGLEERFPPLRVDHIGGVGVQRSGTVWGYELDAEVGAGRLGTVFRASHPASGRDVAVRVVDPSLVNDGWFVRRFEAEARIVERLDHVHLVGLQDFWRDPDGAYLVYPWFEGGSLVEELDGRPWDLRRAGRLIGQVGSALSYLHDRGLVHGGVKPSNVLLDGDGDTYLADAWLPTRLVEGPSDGGATEAADVRGLALLVVAVLTGRWSADPERLPSVAELRPEVDAEVDRAIRAAISAAGDSAGSGVRGLLETVLPALGHGTDVGSVRNPYKGLAAFGEADAVDFFGREELLADLKAVVVEAPLVAVVGPSGSGKSSVVRAGLLPAVHRGELDGEWLVTDLMPGGEPFAELEAALLRVAIEHPDGLAGTLRAGADGVVRAVESVVPDGGRLLLVVDQFEELFSLVDDEGVRQAFLDGLVALAEESDRVRVVVTLRADFFDRPLGYPAFGALMKRGLVPVEALDAEGLRAAIVGPARNVGVEVEPALVAEVVSDVGEEPGRLPLVQFALTELFDRRDGDVLTLDAYREAGGITGALARHAEEVHDGLPQEGREAARQVFLRLVALGEGAEDTRRRVPRSRLVSLSGQQEATELVLDRFGENRLLAFDRDTTTREPTVEVAHEALLRHWPRLRGWIDEAREDLRSHRRLRQAVQEWKEAGEDDAYLLAPERVEAADSWLVTAQVALSGDEQRFLHASRKRKEQLESAEAERAAHEAELERRAVRRLRATVGVLGVGLLVAGALALFAFDQRAQADAERVAAERSERVATARGLASAAVAELTDDPERSILLGVEAVRTTWEADGDVLPEAETALRRAIRASHVTDRLEVEGGFASVSVAPDGRVATLSIEGALTVWDPEAWEPLLEVEGLSHGGIVFYEDVDFTPDGSSFVVADDELRGAIRDTATGEVQVELEGQIARPTFSPDGRFVAGVLRREIDAVVEGDATVAIWDATTGEVVRRIEAEGPRGEVLDLDFSPDGALLGASPPNVDDPTRVWDVETGDLAWSAGDGAINIAFHPDDDLVAVGMEAGLIHLRDARDGASVDTLRGHTAVIQALAFSADGDRLVSGDQDGGSRVWDVDERRELFVLPGHTAPLTDAAFVPGADNVVTTSRDGTARIWDLRVGGGYEYAALQGSPPTVPRMNRTSFSPDGNYLATPKLDGNVRIRELATMDEVLALPHEHPVNVVAHGPDGEVIATSAAVGAPHPPPDEWTSELHLWDARTGDHLGRLAEYEHPPDDIVFNPDGSLFVTPVGTELRAYDPESGDEVFVYVHEHGLAAAARFTPDGERIVVAGQGAALILDAATGEVIDELIRGETGFISVVMADGDRVVTGDVAGRVLLHDLATGEEPREIRDESLAAFVDVAGDLLAIASGDVVTVRDLGSGERIFQVEYEEAAWARPQLSSDGRFLAVAIGEVVHVHVVDPDDLLDLAHDRLTRWWTEAECGEFLQRECPETPS